MWWACLTPIPGTLTVTEFDSAFLYDERPEGVFTLPNQSEPLDNSKLVMGGGLPASMTLELLDADLAEPGEDADPFTPFFNDLFPDVLPNTPIAVYTAAPVQVEIVALELVSSAPIVVATNTMIPFQFFSDDGFNTIDNAFGVFIDEWNVPDTGVLLEGMGTDGTSPFLENWPDFRQYRWKPHPGGWTQVVVGTSTGPAAILHQPGFEVPEPTTAALTALAAAMLSKRRRRTFAA